MIRRPLQHALDELRFGRTGTLNLRSSLPTAAEAMKRADNWLRMKQAEGAREVLIVTGRGNKSADGVPVVREAIRRLLGLLSTRGVVAEHSEHSAGSFAVRLAPFNASVPRPSPNVVAIEPRVDPPTLDGLTHETREQLRVLAAATLRVLGMRDPSGSFIQDEMVRQCAQLAALIPSSIPTAEEREQSLTMAIQKAIERLDEDHR